MVVANAFLPEGEKYYLREFVQDMYKLREYVRQRRLEGQEGKEDRSE